MPHSKQGRKENEAKTSNSKIKKIAKTVLDIGKLAKLTADQLIQSLKAINGVGHTLSGLIHTLKEKGVITDEDLNNSIAKSIQERGFRPEEGQAMDDGNRDSGTELLQESSDDRATAKKS